MAGAAAGGAAAGASGAAGGAAGGAGLSLMQNMALGAGIGSAAHQIFTPTPKSPPAAAAPQGPSGQGYQPVASGFAVPQTNPANLQNSRLAEILKMVNGG